VTLDGKPGGAYDAIIGTEYVSFSPDGRRLAYVVEQQKKQRVVVDGVPGEAYDALGAVFPYRQSALYFSPDSRHLFYIAKSKERWRLVADPLGTTPAYDEVGDILVFDSAETVAFVAREGSSFLRVTLTLPAAPSGPLPHPSHPDQQR
jgi:hypothetical protein